MYLEVVSYVVDLERVVAEGSGYIETGSLRERIGVTNDPAIEFVW
jgi:hypothetical protein